MIATCILLAGRNQFEPNGGRKQTNAQMNVYIANGVQLIPKFTRIQQELLFRERQMRSLATNVVV